MIFQLPECEYKNFKAFHLFFFFVWIIALQQNLTKFMVALSVVFNELYRITNLCPVTDAVKRH